MKQLSKNDAIFIYKSKIWEKWSDEDIVKFQLYQDLIAIPPARFQKALEKILKRPVMLHEIAFRKKFIIEEYLGIRPKPKEEDIINLIPKERRIIAYQ
jgi:lysozyme family protein